MNNYWGARSFAEKNHQIHWHHGHFSALMYFVQKKYKKKLDLRGYDHPGHCIKKKTFSRKSRKPPNPCPTHTQRHRSPVRTGLFLRPVLWRGTDEGIFLTPA